MANSQCDLPPNTLCATFLTRGQTIGLVIIAESGLISVGAVLILFYMIIRNVVHAARDAPKEGWCFFRSPLDVYMLSLFISDLIQGVGLAFEIRWVAQGSVQCGSYCTAQGVIQQLGETTVALATLAIAGHTFVMILFRRLTEGILVPSMIVCALWLYVILSIAIGMGIHTKGGDQFDTPTPYWCWVGSKFTGERIAGEYFWFWFTGLASFVLYLIIFYCLRGNIYTEEARWWRIRFRSREPNLPANGAPATSLNRASTQEGSQASGVAAKQAFIMLLYPICYVGLILPLSIVRWISFVLDARHLPDPNDIRQSIPSAATFVVMSIFGLSGLVNVLLILGTRPGLLLLGEPVTRVTGGPVFESSESVVSSTREPDSLRLRALRPVLNMEDDSEFSRSPIQNQRLGEA